MDTTVSRDDTRPELCSDCLDAGCDDDGASECARDDAYGVAEADPIPVTVEAAIVAITGGVPGSQVRLSLHADTDGEIVWYATFYCYGDALADYSVWGQGRGSSLRLAVADLQSQQATWAAS